ncbi:MAG: hypothetical protein H7321_04970 [Bacteroidia bacterium]|nr:hypothetical protein [Bacteroidia bacterium]
MLTLGCIQPVTKVDILKNVSVKNINSPTVEQLLGLNFLSDYNYGICVQGDDKKIKCWGKEFDSLVAREMTAFQTSEDVLGSHTIKKINILSGYGSCFIRNDDKVYCWGGGYMGDGTNLPNAVPREINTSGVLNGKTIKEIITGPGTCAIANDDLAYCWTEPALSGSSSTVADGMPVAVDTSGVLAGKTIKKLFSNTYFNFCALASDDQLYCWGRNFYYVLGNGGVANSPIPTAVSTAGVLNGKTIKTMAMSNSSACAIANDDLVYCWGKGASGTLGDGNSADSTIPVAVVATGALNGKTIKSIALAVNTACAIASDDLAYCWGVGFNNTPQAVDTSGVLNGKTIKAIKPLLTGFCAIASDDLVYCWGNGTNGVLGNGSDVTSYTPVAVDRSGVLSGKTIKSLHTSLYNACVVASDDHPYCWGKGDYGQLGNGSFVNSNVPVAVDSTGVIAGVSIKNIFVTEFNTFVLGTNNLLYGFGENSSYSLGNNSNLRAAIPVSLYTHTPSNEVFSDIDLKYIDGNGQVCVIRSNNNLYCGKSDKDVAYKFSFGAINVKEVTTPVQNYTKTSCALSTDGKAYCWGDGTSGALGNGSNVSSNTPVAVDTSGVLSGKVIKKIMTVDTSQFCALTTDGAYACWGTGYKGDGNFYGMSNIPVSPDMSGVLSGKTIKSVSLSSYYTFILASDDKVYSWGIPGAMLGNGTTLVFATTPVGVDFAGVLNGLTAKSLSSGSNTACIIASNDKAYCWGVNTDGMVGNGNNINATIPVAVSTAGVLNNKKILKLYTLNNHWCAIADDNKVYCWGYNNAGQLGNGTTTSSNIPVAVSTAGVLNGKIITSLKLAQDKTCAIDSEDKVYCWGNGIYGGLGNGAAASSTLPVAVSF